MSYNVYVWSLVVCVLQFGATALVDSSYNGHVAVVQTLLDAGADVRAKDNVSCSGYTCIKGVGTWGGQGVFSPQC